MVSSLFDQFPLFRDIRPDYAALIRPLFAVCFETAGWVIFDQGDLADALYLVVEGEVLIRYKPEDGPTILVAHVRPGGVVGWSAALGNPTYTSMAVCTTDCQMLRIRSQDLRGFIENSPEAGVLLLEKLAEVVAERLRTSHGHVIALLEQGLLVSEQGSLTTG
jgi:CRP/FNR family cyclic AMP-dependent transcriptional regulator